MNMKNPSTEQPSRYDDLEKMDTLEILSGINQEDQTVPGVLQRAIPAIERFVDTTFTRMQEGGRLFYIGAGTSGRLGVLDASECPPTFGVSHDWIIGLIAGGDKALRNAVENAEDDPNQAWKDLMAYQICQKDTLLGIAASGTTPYVIGGLHCLQPTITPIPGCRYSNRTRGRTRICDRQHPHEIRYGSKTGSQYDLHRPDDQTGSGKGQQNGGHAAVQ